MHRVDGVPPAALHDVRRATSRAPCIAAEMKLIRPWRVLLYSAGRALKHGRVLELLKESPVHAAQGFPALGATIHWELL
jgi:hypothetical protein